MSKLIPLFFILCIVCSSAGCSDRSYSYDSVTGKYYDYHTGYYYDDYGYYDSGNHYHYYNASHPKPNYVSKHTKGKYNKLDLKVAPTQKGKEKTYTADISDHKHTTIKKKTFAAAKKKLSQKRKSSYSSGRSRKSGRR